MDTQEKANFYSETFLEYGVEWERNFILEEAEPTGICVVQEHGGLRAGWAAGGDCSRGFN